MNVQMRIITEENVDQLLSMSFSNNINKLMKSTDDAAVVVKEINQNIEKQLKEVSKAPMNIPEPVIEIETPPTAPASSPIMIAPTAPQPESGSSTPYNPNTAPGSPNLTTNAGPNAPQENVPSPQYNPNTPPGTSESVPFAPASSSTTIPLAPPSTDSSILEVKPPPTPAPNSGAPTEEKLSEDATKKIIL
jgi:hypothetical protein